MKPFMIYTGNHLFHYTKFDSALKIIATRSIRFGDFRNMNDIAEVKREVYGIISPEIIERELEKYRSISLTLDDSSRRGFSIDPLWGHYAQGGNGVCLVFDKGKLMQDITNQFGTRVTIAPIKYPQEFTNAIFTEGDTREAVEKYVEKRIYDIFFTKSIDWEYEQELRILLKDNGQHELLHFGEETLIAAILCLPKEEDYKKTVEYKILKKLFGGKPILHYTTSLGNKELLDENEEKTCGIIGSDLQIHIDWNDIK